MKEKIKNLSNKKIVVTTLCVFALILLLGFTYAYWSRTFNQTGENISTYDCFDISFNENTDGITMENGYPISDDDGLKTESYEVTITNTCKTAATYNVILNKLNTSTLDDNHVKVAVNNDIRLLSETENTTSTISNTSEGKIINTGVLAGSQTKTIKVQNWMDENTSESDGANKTFSYKLTIEAVAGKNNLLAAYILSEDIQNQTPDFKNGYPIKYYKQEKIPDYTETISTYKDHVRAFGSGLSFNSATGYTTLTEPTKYAYLSEGDSLVGMYTCNSNVNGCNEWSNAYKILSVDTTSSTEYNYATVEVYETKEGPVDPVGNGLYVTEDDNGESYYYRGVIKNNYVSFANKLWKIVRINGDGTIRLIATENAGQTVYNNASNELRYVGYTYDNDHICTKANPCTNNSGTSSTVKNYLDEWYASNLEKYDNKIALTSYCNDTSGTSVNIATPSLKCTDTNEIHGGFYKLKIGLLTTPELRMGGFARSGSTKTPSSYNYLILNSDVESWTMTPYTTNDMYIGVASYDGKIYDDDPTNATYVYPVINLKSDVKISSGDGTKEKPYVIE